MAKDKTIRKGIESRRKRIDDASGFGNTDGKGPSTMSAERKTKPAPKEDYEEDFETEAEILELKKKKEDLLKGISGKSEKERKKIREKLKELNDKIMDLENK